MSYATRNQGLQNFFGVFAGIVLTIFWGYILFGLVNVSYDVEYLRDILFPIFYFLFMIIIGLAIGFISYRRNGILIGLIYGILTSLSYLIYIVVIYYSSNSINISVALQIFEIPIGGSILFLASILGCYIKYKIQRGANYTMPSLKEIVKSISSIGGV